MGAAGEMVVPTTSDFSRIAVINRILRNAIQRLRGDSPKANEARARTCGPSFDHRGCAATVGGCVADCFDQAALISPSWVSAVTPSSRPISSTILPLITFSTVV